ncbi:hypothetical protein [Amycolatopsis sp. NPDC054798]
MPWIRPRSSWADVADHFQVLGSACAAGEIRVGQILTDGAGSPTVKQTGKRFTTSFAVRSTVGGGLITRYHV